MVVYSLTLDYMNSWYATLANQLCLYLSGPDHVDNSRSELTHNLLSVMRRLVVFCPYCISTVLMVSVHRTTGNSRLLMCRDPPHLSKRSSRSDDAKTMTRLINLPFRPGWINELIEC